MHKENKKLQKVVVIVGPTASGKTDWSLKLAQKFNGEIISADSRQVYKKMDIGTGKEPGVRKWSGLHKCYIIHGISHHLIDFLDPGKSFTVAEFREKAIKYCKLAHKHEKIPFVAGGTGLYVHALVDNLQIPRVLPNQKLRRSLENKTNEELVAILKKIDMKTAKSVDPDNKRRLIRALEVCIFSGKPFSEQQKKGPMLFNFLQIGIEVPRDELYQRIGQRIDKMMKMGLLKEVEQLVKQKYDWNLPSMSGIGYRQFRDYFNGQITLEQAIDNLKRDNRHYAKRQITWFKRDKNIKWCKNYEEAEELINNFLHN